jgi:hypothetical protein
VIHAQHVNSRYLDAAQAYGGGGERAGLNASMDLALRVLWFTIKKAGGFYVRCRPEHLTAAMTIAADKTACLRGMRSQIHSQQLN